MNDGRQYGRGYSEVQGVDYYSSDYSGEIEEGAEVTKIWEEGSDTKGSLYTKGSLIISGNGEVRYSERMSETYCLTFEYGDGSLSLKKT